MNKDSFTYPPKPMTCPVDTEITGEIIQKYVEIHEKECMRYKQLMSEYIGNHEILSQSAKEEGKPDNRIVVDFPKYIVDTFMGFFNGIPIKKKHEDGGVYEAIAEFDDTNDVENEEYELAKKACIQGRAYEYMYQDEETKTCITHFSADEMFIVYDDTVKQQPMFAVRVGEDEDGKFLGELITMEGYSPITTGEDEKLVIKEEGSKEHPYEFLPVNEWIHNEERMSIFEPVQSLINAMNKAFSEKANDVEYFADAYLAIIGAKLDGEVKINRDNRTINIWNKDGTLVGTLDAKFLEKPSADETQEHFLDRLERFIYQISMVANISDEDFGASSGTALAYKLQSMSNLAMTMQRKVVKSLDYRYRNFCSLTTNVPANKKDGWKDIEYSFTRNMPKNVKEESEIIQNLDGHVSDETKLSVLSKVDDPKKELERMAEEEKQQPRVMDLVESMNQQADDVPTV